MSKSPFDLTSRRTFLAVSAVAGAAGLVPHTALAQATVNNYPDAKPVVDLTNEQIVQITMVVKDAERVAKNFSEVYGPSWQFFEFRPTAVVLHDQEQANAAPVLKLAIGNCGGYSFKLVQPVSGPSSYADFLAKHGEGFYSVGLAPMRNYNPLYAALKKAGVGIDMQGDAGNGSQFVVWDTAADIGCRVEMMSIPDKVVSANLKKTGSFVPAKPSIVDMSLPYLSGGRRFTQIGLVVKDAEYGGRRFAELFGIRNWRFQPIPVVEGILHGKKLAEKDLPSATVVQGVAYWGGAQLEFLAPVPEGPGGIHREFLDRHGSGNGFQHLMISPSAGDHDALSAAFEKAGMPKAWAAAVDLGGVGRVRGDYIDMQSKLGGFLLEFNG